MREEKKMIRNNDIELEEFIRKKNCSHWMLLKKKKKKKKRPSVKRLDMSRNCSRVESSYLAHSSIPRH